MFADRGGGGQVYFAYDATGQRVRKAYEHGGVVEERIYLDGYELYRNRNLATRAVALERQTLHVDDAGRLAALVETKTIDTSVPGFTPTTRQRYQLTNHLDSTAAELDDTGGVITYEEYFPFGGTAWQATASTTDVSARRYRYTGKERDDETGLYYHGARYYAAWLGRWTSADPAGFVDGTDLYRYARNNPILLHDPFGTDPVHARLISIDDLKPQNSTVAANADKVDLPKSDNSSPTVTIEDADAGNARVSTLRDVWGAPNYVDNNIKSVGAPDADIWTLRIKTLRYVYKNQSTLDVTIDSVDFNAPGAPANQYKQINGTIYPVGRDGRLAFDPTNTPNIVRGALGKLNTAADISNQRVEIAELTNAFSANIAALGGTLSLGNHAAVISREYFQLSGGGGGGGSGGGGGGGDGGGPFVPDEYWQRKAPDQVAPGTDRLDFTRISGRTGRTEQSRVIYDQYGRQTYRVDKTDHMRPADHTNPHLHQRVYKPFKQTPHYVDTLHNLKK